MYTCACMHVCLQEKARKKFKHTLPKLETKLVGLLSQWETERGEAFTVNGVRYLDIIETQVRTAQVQARMRALVQL